jgi:Flp pilus assembly protein TadB
MEYRSFIPLIAAILLALLAFWAAGSMSFIVVGRSAAGRIGNYAEKDRRDMIDRLGDLLATRLGLSLESWKHELSWAQIGGQYLTTDGQLKSVGTVLGQSVLFAAIGIAYIVIFHSYGILYIAMVAVAAYYPYMTLKGRADTARESVKRGLPEAAAMIAAEMNAGGSITTAVERASTLPGSIGQILQTGVERARLDGALLFSQSGIPGALLRQLSELKFAPLETFAARMDAVAERGAEGPQRMTELARDLAVEYQITVARASETLENKLLMPMTIFFFVPFLAAIFIPLMVNLLNTF